MGPFPIVVGKLHNHLAENQAIDTPPKEVQKQIRCYDAQARGYDKGPHIGDTVRVGDEHGAVRLLLPKEKV